MLSFICSFFVWTTLFGLMFDTLILLLYKHIVSPLNKNIRVTFSLRVTIKIFFLLWHVTHIKSKMG